MTSKPQTRAEAASEVILNALAAGLTHAEAGALAGLGPKSVQRRLADPEFAGEVTRRRASRVEEITGRLTTMASTAVTVLSELMGADKPMVRLRAAEQTLLWLARLRREVDFDIRLSRLEGGSVGQIVDGEDDDNVES